MSTLRVVKGAPDDEELAAVVAALVLVRGRLAGGATPSAPSRPTRWRTALASGPPARGPDAWRGGR